MQPTQDGFVLNFQGLVKISWKYRAKTVFMYFFCELLVYYKGILMIPIYLVVICYLRCFIEMLHCQKYAFFFREILVSLKFSLCPKFEIKKSIFPRNTVAFGLGYTFMDKY